MKRQIRVKSGDTIYLKCRNAEKSKEWTIYRININPNAYKGDGLDDIFLYNTTGYYEEE